MKSVSTIPNIDATIKTNLPHFYAMVFCLMVVLLNSGCNTNLNSPKEYHIQYPTYFPDPLPSPDRNPISEEGVALGEKLFFDTSLSADEQIACASCHLPEKSFADGKKFSAGHSGNDLKRNTPALINLAWQKHFFWDGGVKNLESLSFAALLNKDEMGADLDTICYKLNRSSDYLNRFKEAFQIDSISSAYVSRALAQYMRTLVSKYSKYDSVQLNLSSFSSQESLGKDVFYNNCSSCHIAPLFMDNDFHHNGIQQSFSSNDLYLTTGRFRITRDSMDLGKYKTPTLRNLNKTSPYMHDGRFSTLDQVLDHYQNILTSNQIRDSLVYRISFTDKEKNALKAFLNTLNDEK